MKFRTLYFTSLLPVASAALVIVGCDDTRRDGVGRPGVEVERSTGQKVDDKEVASRVKSALDDNVAYKFPDVQVNVYNGVVQLSGFVATREQKSKAEDIVKAVTTGVNVENKITVKD